MLWYLHNLVIQYLSVFTIFLRCLIVLKIFIFILYTTNGMMWLNHRTRIHSMHIYQIIHQQLRFKTTECAIALLYQCFFLKKILNQIILFAILHEVVRVARGSGGGGCGLVSCININKIHTSQHILLATFNKWFFS